MAKILITRSLEQGGQFIDRYCECFGEQYRHHFECEPLIKIEHLSRDIHFDPYDVFIATSQNAISDDLPLKPLFHVGMNGIRTVDDLIAFLKTQDRDLKYLYLRGKDIRRDLKSELTECGFEVEDVVVYQAAAAEYFTASFISLLKSGGVSAVSFFSARTAQIFMKLSQDKDLFPFMKEIKVLCISNTVLDCVYSEFFDDVRVADTPDATGMIDLIKELTDEHPK